MGFVAGASSGTHIHGWLEHVARWRKLEGGTKVHNKLREVGD